MENYELTTEETDFTVSGDIVAEQPMMTLEDAIVKFKSYEEIVDYVDSLEFFDQNCNLLQSKIDQEITLNAPISKLIRFQQELYVVNRISTIHKYKNAFKDELAVKWLKSKITDPQPEYKSEAEEVLGILPNRFGAHMEPDEFDMYVKAFDELYTLEKVEEEQDFFLPFNGGCGFRHYRCKPYELIQSIRKDKFSGMRVTDLLIHAKKLSSKFTNKELLALVTTERPDVK